MIIDTHHHYWNYNPIDFDWIDDDMAAIRRSFLPQDLKSTLKDTGVTGVVSIQARQCMEETDWLLKMAAENEFMKGIVGWLPLASENIDELLAQYSPNKWLKAVRHVVQGEPDPEFILGMDFNRGISQLRNYGLVYDILIFEHQLPNTIRFVDQHPDQQFVLDHNAKPRIKANELEPWAKNIQELAKRENVCCKISGMVTEADFKNWTEAQLQPYLDVVLDAFGPERLLYGSDWPVCLVASEYANWLDLVKRNLARLSADEQQMIFCKNAEKVYQLETQNL
ncbi:amidohydrolase family protein [Mangrovibacterium diazotrophicum]|uniref:L-fuconolactonase n=1 Tax=Mangrovibacterium diazotrophicum TaxID=1261403 RepID=A0A419W375_9BACT|nr:amidohydrolase family protein [Mangrovibacterium diazotrophicum]RKD89884.1 L-fuconolactonase [Mangrovibacterium diazotrophicum]